MVPHADLTHILNWKTTNSNRTLSGKYLRRPLVKSSSRKVDSNIRRVLEGVGFYDVNCNELT
jgi:hypothetical protein